MSNRCLRVSSCDKVRLPTDVGAYKKHPYCVLCGIVKNASSDRGKRLGYFSNVLANLKRYLEREGYKISQAKIRLKELENLNANDIYSISFSKRRVIFVKLTLKRLEGS